MLAIFAWSVAFLDYSNEGQSTEDTDEMPEEADDILEGLDGTPGDSEEDLEDDEDDPGDGANERAGVSGVDETLAGSEEADILTGNSGDQDVLLGEDGDDELHLGADNTALGGEGADSFIVDDSGSLDTTVEDFALGTDRLQLVETTSEFTDVIASEDGLHVIDTLNLTTIVTLSGVTLDDGEGLEIDFLDGNGDVSDMVRFEDPDSDAPFALDAIWGTAADDTLSGTAGNDVIFGEDGADTIDGGDGEDALFSGSGLIYNSAAYNHSPGTLSKVGSDGDVLNGGSGDDDLWIGPATTAMGGAGADTFYAFANVYETDTPGAVITDFDPIEDRLLIDFPVGPTADDSFESAIAGLSVEYDVTEDVTQIVMNGVAVAVLNGDQSNTSLALHDDYSTGEDRWIDGDGTPITAEAGSEASIVLTAVEYYSVLGV